MRGTCARVSRRSALGSGKADTYKLYSTLYNTFRSLEILKGVFSPYLNTRDHNSSINLGMKNYKFIDVAMKMMSFILFVLSNSMEFQVNGLA